MSRSTPAPDQARGLLLGLLLGDALALSQQAGTGRLADGPLPASPAGQLACSTVDGLVRGHLRMAHRGIGHPPSTVWGAYVRWARLQQVPGLPDLPGLLPPVGEPDGWLGELAVLRRRAGTAPATVAALQQGRMGTPDLPGGSSAGHHALSNAAPAALFTTLGDTAELGRHLATLTHGAAAGQAAATGVAVLGAALHPTGDARERDGADVLRALLRTPAASAALGADGPAGTAAHALRHGTQAALDHPERRDLETALQAGARAGAGAGAGAFAGALLGAAHGAGALPQQLLHRLELANVGDTLARDALSQQRDHPSGTEYAPNEDRWWLRRYPGASPPARPRRPAHRPGGAGCPRRRTGSCGSGTRAAPVAPGQPAAAPAPAALSIGPHPDRRRVQDRGHRHHDCRPHRAGADAASPDATAGSGSWAPA